MNRRGFIASLAALPFLFRHDPVDDIVIYRQAPIPPEVVVEALDFQPFDVPNWAWKWHKYLQEQQSKVLNA